MYRRPWPIVILAVLHLLAPVGNCWISAHLSHVSLKFYFTALFLELSPLDLVSFFLAHPLAGLAIYAVKPWSYPVFISITAFNIFKNHENAMMFPQAFNSFVLYTLQAVNVGVVGYFLLKAVRTPYFDPKLRWWESKPRYVVNFPGSLQGQTQTGVTCSITDFSVGGVFITSDFTLNAGEEVILNFSALDTMNIAVKAQIMHVRNGKLKGYGLKFINLDKNLKKSVSAIIKTLLKTGAPPRMKKAKASDDFKQWAIRLFKTGKGLVPEYAARTAPTAKTQSAESSSEDDERKAA